MLSILPLLFLLLAARWAAARPREAGVGFDVRDALMIGAVWTGVWAVAAAELFSVFHRFDTLAVVTWWFAGVGGLAFLNWWKARRIELDFKPARDRLNLVLIAAAGAVVLLTAVLAFTTPPSTPDVLCYHLPRQIHWIQNRTVAHFPTGDLRQLEMPPMAEFLGAQLLLLSGGDWQANLVQWFAYLLTALTASAIARDLGAGPRGQAFAALLALFNPAAASQSVNGKNDLVVGLWLLALTWIAARVWMTRYFSVRHAAFMGSSLGLLLLTKGTGYVVAMGVCIVIAIAAFRSMPRRAPLLGAIVIVIACILNAPHWSRNYRAFGSPVALPASKGGFGVGNSVHTPAVVASNIVRTITLHTNTPWPKVNAWQERAVESIHTRLGIDPVDPRTTPSYATRFAVIPLWGNDGNNPAPVHLALGIAMLGAFRPRRPGSRRGWPVFLLPYVSVLLFAYFLKWQPHNVRLQIPIVASIAAPLGAWLTRRPVVMVLSTLAAGYLTAMALLWNDAKPLLGHLSIIGKSREEIMYQIQAREHELENAGRAVAAVAEIKPRSVAIDIQPHTNEYSLMRMLRREVNPPPRLYEFRQYFGPKNRLVVPEVVLSSWTRPAGALFHDSSGTRYVCVAVFEPFKVYQVAERVGQWKLSTPVPPFFGWDWERGLQPPEGPYPQFELPVVRWAKEPAFQFRFESDGAAAALVMEVRRNETVNQELAITLNGSEVHRLQFGDAWAFLPVTIPLSPNKGPNILRFEFANLQEPGPPQAALFRKVQIIPSAWLQPSSPPPPAPQPPP